MSLANPLGVWTWAGFIPSGSVTVRRMTSAYDSGWPAGSPTYSSSANADARDMSSRPSLTRCARLSYSAAGEEPVATPITTRGPTSRHTLATLAAATSATSSAVRHTMTSTTLLRLTTPHSYSGAPARTTEWRCTWYQSLRHTMSCLLYTSPSPRDRT